MNIIELRKRMAEKESDNSNVNKLKEEYFARLFEQKVIRYDKPTDNKYVDFNYVCTNKSLEKFFNKLFFKYHKKHSLTDFIFECMYWAYIAIQRFTVKDNGSWEGILAGTDKKNIGRLISNIKTTVEHEIYRFMNEDIFITKGEVDGEKGKHKKIQFTFNSLDSLLLGSESEETNLLNTISNDNSYWSEKGEYYYSPFIKWFNENKKDILTKNQYKKLQKLRECQHDKDEYTIDDCYEVAGIRSDKLRSEFYPRVIKRVLKAWEKENKSQAETQLQMEKESGIKLLSQVIDIVYSEEVAGQNKAISDWIVKNLDNEQISNLVYDNITCSESKLVVFAYNNYSEQTIIPSKVLYKIVAVIEDKLEQLKQMETESVPFYRTKEEQGNWTESDHISYEKYLNEFTKNNCYTFDSNKELIRVEGWKKHKKDNNNNNLFEILPTGIERKINSDEKDL